jgi:hypothetical protein
MERSRGRAAEGGQQRAAHRRGASRGRRASETDRPAPRSAPEARGTHALCVRPKPAIEPARGGRWAGLCLGGLDGAEGKVLGGHGLLGDCPRQEDAEEGR